MTSSSDPGSAAALWLDSPRAAFRVGVAPRPTPGPTEILVRARAVAVNPVDAVSGFARRFVYPWLRYPAVLGTDVAGEVLAVGDDVDRFTAGDRVVGLATGQERFRNSPAHGAFRHEVLLDAGMVSPVPPAMSLVEAVVLPLGVTTAAAGLFQPDQLALDSSALDVPALASPAAGGSPQADTVLVWGGSTSVGMNAIQLASYAGYRVIATASPRNHDLLRSLGAQAVADYRDPAASRVIVDDLAGRRLVGALAIGAGSLARVIGIARRVEGTGRVASAYPTPVTALRRLAVRPLGVRVSAIWGGAPAQNALGPAVFADFLGPALADGRYRPAPAADVVGDGLAAVPDALARLRKGVSARKLVVTL